MSDALYRGFTRAELDRAYSPSSKVASITPFLQRYADDSAAARTRHDRTRWSTVHYGNSNTHTLDLFQPHKTSAPTLVFIHGGYWQALHKDDASFPATAITDAGCAYVALNYTLAPAARLDAIVEECRQALAHLWTHRTALGLDPGGLVLAGHSAGAHLTAMMLTTDWAARGIDPAFIKGALLLGGIYDLEPIRQSYVNDALGLDATETRRNSPLFDAPRLTCPLVVTWAEHDTDEFKRQSQALADAWRPAVPNLVQFEQSGVNHFDSLFDWYDPNARLTVETRRMLQTNHAGGCTMPST
jgi:arylformamidase